MAWNLTGYIVFYKEKSKVSDPYKSMATSGLKVTVIGLKVYTEYALRVLAYNSQGNGLGSELMFVTTQGGGRNFRLIYLLVKSLPGDYL